MPAATETPFAGVFDQALQTYGEALKAGIKVQEQFAGYWADALQRAVPTTAEYSNKVRNFFNEAAPAAQRNADELLKLLDQNYRRSVELFRRACDAGTSANAANDYQARIQALWQASIDLVKENAQATTQASVRALELFADLFRQNGSAATVVPPTSGPKNAPKS